MNKKIVFKIDNKDFEIILENDLCVNVYENGVKREANEEEYEKAAIVLDTLLPDEKNSIEVDTIALDEHKYKIFLDTVKSIYYFLEIAGDEYKIPEEKAIVKLNFIYNHVPDIVNDEYGFDEEIIKVPEIGIYDVDVYPHERIKDGNYIRVCKQIFQSAIAILVSANILFGSLTILNKRNRSFLNRAGIMAYEEEQQKEFRVGRRMFDEAEVISAIDSNLFVSEDTKKTMYNFKDVLAENADYIDFDHCLEVLKNIHFEYHSEYREDNDAVRADYTRNGENKHRVRFWGVSAEIQEGDIPENCLLAFIHETGHGFEVMSGIKKHNKDFREPLRIHILEELATELFARSYYSYFSDEKPSSLGYEKMMPVMYALGQIIDIEKIRQYKFESDANVLVDALCEIDGDRDRAYAFLTGVETAYHYYKDNKALYFEKCQEILSELKHYYEVKYARPLESDMFMNICFYGTSFSSEKIDEAVKWWISIPNRSYTLVTTGFDYLSKRREGNAFLIEVHCDYIKRIVLNEDNRMIDPLAPHMV